MRARRKTKVWPSHSNEARRREGVGCSKPAGVLRHEQLPAGDRARLRSGRDPVVEPEPAAAFRRDADPQGDGDRGSSGGLGAPAIGDDAGVCRGEPRPSRGGDGAARVDVARMAAKKPAKPKLPPMWPRVVVATALASATDRARVFEAVRELDRSGVVSLVLRYVHAESGTLMRQGASWPAWICEVAASAFRTAELLEQLVQECRLAAAHDLPKPVAKEFEDDLLAVLQLLMDELFEQGKNWRPGSQDALAGLSGVSPELARFYAASGVEAAVHLAWCVRRAVLGKVEEPFWPFVVSKRSMRTMRLQVGRAEPESCAELHADDVAILQACEGGPLQAKEVSGRAVVGGRNLLVSHVTKRKRDLTAWGLLTAARAFELSEKGRAWLDDVVPSMRDGG